MQVGYVDRGPIPEGRLPVFSTDTVQEAKDLITLCCPLDAEGNYYARELVEEQTLDNLQKFSDRLQAGWEHMQRMKRERTTARD